MGNLLDERRFRRLGLQEWKECLCQCHLAEIIGTEFRLDSV